MTPHFSTRIVWFFLLAGVVLSYFVAFPGDAVAVASPIATVLEITKAISPWLYVLISVCVVCWTIIQVWGRRGAVP